MTLRPRARDVVRRIGRAATALFPAWLVAVTLLLFALAPLARAEEARPRTSSLSWVRLDGAESCIATPTLAQRVETRLARKVFVSPSEADVSVEGHVSRERSPAGWRAVITVRDATGALLGTREVRSAEASCSSLDDPIALVVSVLIDAETHPDAGAGSGANGPAPPAPSAPPPQVVVRRERVYVPVPERAPRPWRFEGGAAAAGALGLLPNAALGVDVAALLEPPGFWGIELSGAYWFPAKVPAEGEAYTDVALVYGQLALCPLRWARDRAALRLCAGAQVGSVRSRGVGFDRELSNESVVVNAVLPTRLSIRIAGPLFVTAGAALVVAIVRPELTYGAADGSTRTIFRAPPLAGVFELGLAVHFP